MNTSYFFLPYLRTGLAAKLQESDLSSKRACLDFSLNIKANKIDGSSEEKELTKRIHLYGPGDITGFEKTIVVAHDPADQTGDFEPNYFPAIQFRDPDFLWRYNANVADENNKLHPWLTLVVLIAEDKGDIHREFVVPDKSESIRRAEKKLPPYIENVNVATLPDLNESWRWAHVQVTGSRTTFEGNLNENLTDIYRNYPERLACRLLCARRLRPGTLYNAFVVPTFKLGLVAAGLLDSTGDMTASTLAWSTGTEESMRLPYYYKWEFRTGQSGDFEHLVRRLEPRQLTQVGLREMDCSNLGWEIPSVDEDGILELEGALKTVNTMSSFWGLDRPDLSQLEATRCQLAELLNRNSGITNKTVFFIPDTETPFFIKEAEVTVVKNEALVSWKTDIETTSKVEYGRINLNQSVQSNVFEKDHSVLIDNLMSNTVYRLRIVATTQNGLSAVSQVVELRSGDDKPFVLPPIYGRWHAGRDRVDCEEKGSWFDELNLDPRHRAAAGVGAEVIRQKQEPLMASAWEQVGEVRKANELLNRTHVGVEVSKNVFQRFNDLSLDNFLTLSRPLHGRIKTRTGGKTISGLLGASRIPNEALNYSLRRLCRPFGPIRKRQMMAKNITVLSTNTPFLKRFNGESVSTRTEDIFTAAEASINPAGTRGMISTSSTRANEQVVMPSINFGGKTLIDQYTQLKQNNSSIKLTKTDRNIALAFTPVLQSIQNQQKNFNNQKTSAPYLDLNVLREQLIMKLNPQETLARKFCKRVKMPSKALETELPDNIMVAPKFSQPMYEALFEISKEWLIPGIENIPPNTVSLLKTNQRFIEAYLCGCNHEFAAELLWREYPTDQRGTYFDRFWKATPHPDVFVEKYNGQKDSIGFSQKSEIEKERYINQILEQQADIFPIHQWDDHKRLGYNNSQNSNTGSEKLVLLIRGDFLKKYPNAVIYALRRDEVFDDFGNISEQLLNHKTYPVFSATIPADITLLGFDIELDSEFYNKWFFVIEERVSESRFGLDVPNDVALADWKDLAWNHFVADSGDDSSVDDNFYGKYLNGLSPISEAIDDIENLWNSSSAWIAKNTLQQPVRIVISANQLIPGS